MSAFIVSERTITSCLINHTKGKRTYIWKGEIKTIDAVTSAQLLINANYRSVNSRYNTSTTPHKYTMMPLFENEMSVVQTLKSIECYMYQACDDPSWRTSEARLVCTILERYAIDSLPGYDDASSEL